MDHKTIAVTVAIPIYNEEIVLPEFLQRIEETLLSIPGCSFRLLLINDGSTDDSRRLLEEPGIFPRCIINFSRNFGHQAAITAAIDHADCDALIIMDGDLQDPPEHIPLLLSRFREGCDLVYTYRISRKGNRIKKICYFLYYRLLKLLASTSIVLDSGDYVVMSRRMVLALRGMRECHRFYRGLRAWVGFKQAGVPLARPDRHSGKSKYSIRKLLQLGMDGLFSFSIMPLRFASFFGFLIVLFCIAFLIYSVVVYFTNKSVPTGFTALMVMLLLTSGIQLSFLGLVGEYVGRIYEQSKGRPNYIVESVNKFE